MAFAIAALAGRSPSRIVGADSVAISYPGLFRDARPARRVKTDKVYLVGFMGAGKTSVGRALARRLDWRAVDIDELIEQREHLPVSEIFAKHGEPYFRAVEREVLDGPGADPPRRRRHRRRHVRGSAEPGGHQPRRRVGLARCAARSADCAYTSRRPPSACRRSRRARAAVSSRGAPRTSTRTCVWTPAVPASMRSSSSWSTGCRHSRIAARLPRSPMRYLVLTDIHANLEATRGLPGRRRGARLRPRRSCSATSSATAPDPNAVDRARAGARRRPPSSAAITTRWPAASNRPDGFNAVAQARRALDARYADAGEPRSGSRRCRTGPVVVDDAGGDLPRLAVRRRRVHLRRARRACARSRRRSGRSASSATRTSPSTFELDGRPRRHHRRRPSGRRPR